MMIGIVPALARVHLRTGHGDEENVPLMPRVDKGDGRAKPGPEEPEKVASPCIPKIINRYFDVEEGGGSSSRAGDESRRGRAVASRISKFVFVFVGYA